MVVRLRRGALWGAALIALLPVPPGHAAEPEKQAEYRVKAAYLAKFPLFVRWPAAGEAAAAEPLIIAVLGQDPFGTALDSLDGRRIGERTARVVRASDASELRPGSLVFVSAAGRPELAGLLGSLHEKAILTVGDSDDFSSAGGIIGFVIVEDSVRFRINVESARAAGLEISSRLLRLAVQNDDDD